MSPTTARAAACCCKPRGFAKRSTNVESGSWSHFGLWRRPVRAPSENAIVVAQTSLSSSSRRLGDAHFQHVCFTNSRFTTTWNYPLDGIYYLILYVPSSRAMRGATGGISSARYVSPFFFFFFFFFFNRHRGRSVRPISRRPHRRRPEARPITATLPRRQRYLRSAPMVLSRV
jgi:hypothetical protein